MVMKKLTMAQKTRLKKHSVHHTKKHMTAMRSAMKKGTSFTKAHAQAKRKVGNGKY
jgi:hypothetical protein|tara:strand:+ start:224 stop:391 length:168 start_codon:yes stop_codon:yes gene_type:complete